VLARKVRSDAAGTVTRLSTAEILYKVGGRMTHSGTYTINGGCFNGKVLACSGIKIV
jgi:hypothetical protein